MTSGLPHRRLAAAACLGLFVTMFLPWYSRSTVGVDAEGRPVSASQTLNAFQVFSFVEAAVLLVAVAVLWLVWSREQQRAFHLPGGDGVVIAAAGLWVCLLVFWRQFDQPDADPVPRLVTETGVTWGIFVTFLVGALLAWSGIRMRRAHVPEPPLPAAGETPAADRRRPRPPQRRVARRDFTDVPEPAEPPTMRMPGEAPTRIAPPAEERPTRVVRPDAPEPDQLSFDD